MERDKGCIFSTKDNFIPVQYENPDIYFVFDIIVDFINCGHVFLYKGLRGNYI